ncbi:MAG: serine/threonine-protein kinase [Pseudomonadota bacterium]
MASKPRDGQDLATDPTWGPGEPAEASGGPPPARYRRVQVLGQGGMGRVWLAEDEALGRQVALKELTRESASQRRSFTREARLTAGLDHPGIVPIFDVGVHPDGAPFYVMRVVRGRSLQHALADCEGLAQRLALLDPLIETCQALAHAHALGVVHRDIKPENVMIGPFGEVQVVDWGIARIFSTDSPLGPPTAQEHPGLPVGTPDFMSPEQAAGEPVDARSDVWALGVLLYEILAGRRPFEAPDPRVVIARVLDLPVPPVRSLAPRAPAELAAIAMRALQRDPAARYADAGALLADLKAFRSGEHVSAYAYSLGEEAGRLLRRHRRALLGLAAGLLVAVGATAVGFARTAAQRDRAEAARTGMAEALQDARVEKARGALEAGEPAAALAFAGAALELGPNAEAVGLAAQLLGTLPYRWSAERLDLPGPCVDLSWVPALDAFLCAGPHGVWLGGAAGVRVLDPGPATRARLSPDRRWVGVVERGVRLRVVEVQTGRDALHLEPMLDVVAAPAFHPDGQRVAWADGRTVYAARLPAEGAPVEIIASWNTGSQVGGVDWFGDELRAWLARGALTTLGDEQRSRLLSGGGFTFARPDAQGDGVVFGTLAGAVRLVRAGEEAPITLRERGPRMVVGWSEDERAVWAADEGGVEVWDLEGHPLLRLPAIEPGTALPPVIDASGTVRLIGPGGLRAVSPAPEARLPMRMDRGVTSCTPAGEELWCAGDGRVLALAPGKPLSEVPLPGADGVWVGLWSLCASSGGVIATNGAALLHLGPPSARVVLRAGEPLVPLACGVDGTAATASEEGLLLWTGEGTVRTVPVSTRVEEVLAWDGRWLARSGERWAVHAADGLLLGALVGADGAALAVGDGGRLALLGPDGVVAVREVGASEPSAHLLVQPKALDVAWVGPARIATYDGRTIQVHDLGTPEPVAVLGELPVSLSWWGTITGQPWLLTATHDGTIAWWDLRVLDRPPEAVAARIREETGFLVQGGRLALAQP